MSNSNALADEVVVLKSIYDKDLVYNDSTITITLFPLQEKEKKEIYTQVDLCVTCSKSYPNIEPEISLRNVKGLSNNQIETLYSILKRKSKSLKGTVMIYELACSVREFLSENNRPEKKSFYEEMITRREKQEQEKYQKKVSKMTKLVEDIEQKQKGMLHSTENSEDEESEREDFLLLNLNSKKSKSGNSFESEEMSCQHRSCKYLQFHSKVLRGRCLEHGASSISYHAIDSSTGDQLLLLEWILKPKNKSKETLGIVQQHLESIEDKVNILKKLCHKNLSSYIDFKWVLDKGEFTVHCLEEFVTSCKLSSLIDMCIDFNLNIIRDIVYSVLSALDHLHSYGFVHGDLNESNICFTKSSVIKVSNYTVKKVMDDLDYSCKYDKLQETKDKSSQKSDIFNMGLVILKIMKVTFISNENIIVPDFQPPELKEFVEKCLIENEEGRWNAKELMNHKFFHLKETKQIALKKKFSKDHSDLELSKGEVEKPFDTYLETPQNVNSRLAKEFKILSDIGSGSFGKVLKVRNKLDGSIYAIKAIRLNIKKDKQLDKKMIREVKFLSKLNHENVVRYYTSWIETDSDLIDDTLINDSDYVDGKLSNANKTNTAVLENENDDYDDDDGDDDEDDDDVDVDDDCSEEEEEEEEEKRTKEEESSEILENKFSEGKENESSYIVFLKDINDKSCTSEDEINNDKTREIDLNFVEPNRTMYIQMEFCENSTLRIAINDSESVKLCDDEPRLWRLFREIVEGLGYVHGQGMIHRDLKPENIFLDSNDHVKIGDFGLATISVVSKSLTTYLGPADRMIGGGDNEASSQNVYDDFHTGKVGTSLYVAPEVDKTFGKSYYNKKVDIYSLGIIFFEMCVGPFTTSSERIETISNLRKPEIILPSSWREMPSNKRKLVKMLLNHDSKSRPSCQELLEGSYLPPAEFEYEQLIKQTLVNSQSKAYKYLISACFDQEVRIEEDITYQLENVRSEKQHFLLDLVKESIEKILKKHGAIYMSAPLLLPQNEVYRNAETRVQLMTHSGSIVNLPYDLQVCFARYVACKAFIRLRRYAIERVFKEKKIHGLHPKEQFECSFDLVTPSFGVESAELEIFSVIQEIINNFDSLKSRNCMILLNHALLLKAVLIHLNLEKRYSEIFKILSNAKENKYCKSKIESNIKDLGIQNVGNLINLFLKEDSLDNIKKELFSLINKRGKALELLNEGFKKLTTIINNADKLGVKVPIKVAMSVVCKSDFCRHIMFNVVYRIKQNRKKEENVTLMSGCRYDGLVAEFRRMFELTAPCQEGLPSAVGISIYLDKIAGVLKEDNTLSEYVVVCSFDPNISTNAKETVAKKLWECGIKCYIEHTVETLEELTEYCRENKIIHIINLKDERNGLVSIMTWDNDQKYYIEKKIKIRDVTEYILKYSKTPDENPSPLLHRRNSESQGRTLTNDMPNGYPSINIKIINDEKLSPNQRKQYENEIRTRISSAIGIFSPRALITVVGVFLDEQKVKEVVLNYKTNEFFDNYKGNEMLDGRTSLKKYVLKICSKLKGFLSDDPNAVIILYSLLENEFQCILNR